MEQNNAKVAAEIILLNNLMTKIPIVYQPVAAAILALSNGQGIEKKIEMCERLVDVANKNNYNN